jgi:hypothetical protein
MQRFTVIAALESTAETVRRRRTHRMRSLESTAAAFLGFRHCRHSSRTFEDGLSSSDQDPIVESFGGAPMKGGNSP